MDDLAGYVVSVSSILDALRRHYPRTTTLALREHHSSLSGLFKSELRGLHERLGYTLEVKHEFFEKLRDGSIQKNYRYRIMRGSEELIRFQTDRKHPENAHFQPHFESDHFEISKWPPELRDMNFPVIYKFFLEFIRMEGELPEPFRSAKP